MVLATSCLPAVGAACLGVFVGYMVWFFVVRFAADGYTSAGLVAVLGVVAGGVVVEFLKAGTNAHQRWWYPIGLAIGWLVFVIAHFINWLVKKEGKPFPALIAEEPPDA